VSRMDHPCKFSISGCPIKQNLWRIFQHEEKCLYRPVKCAGTKGCGMEFPMKEAVNHLKDYNCCLTFEGNKMGNDFPLKMKGSNRHVEEWKGSGPLTYLGLGRFDITFIPIVLKYDSNVFFAQVERVAKIKKWMFYAGMPGNEEDCAKYRVRFTLKDRKTAFLTSLNTVMTCEIVPLDMFFTRKDVGKLGAYGSVTDRVMQNVFYIDDSYIKFGIIIEIIKL